MKKSKTSNFIAKLLKKVSCFHLSSDSVSHEEDVSDQHEPQQQPPQQLVIGYGGVGVNVGSMKSDEVTRKPPQQLVICYGGVGVNKESMKSTQVPMKYVSSSVTFRALLKQSGVELETTLLRGWVVIWSVVIWSEFAEVESTLKLVEAIVKGKEREKKSS